MNNRIVFALIALIMISTTCTGGTNTACTDAFDSVVDTCDRSCSEMCLTQLNAARSACETSTDSYIQQTLGTYTFYCGTGGVECAAALRAFYFEDTCEAAITDPSFICYGTCRALADAYINTCPADDPIVILQRNDINELCGSGNMLKASGVITLLISIIAARIF